MPKKPLNRSANVQFTNQADIPDGYAAVVFDTDNIGHVFAYAPTGASTPHATTHYDAGSDPVDIKQLDGFPGTSTTFLRGDGTFATPPTTGAGASGPFGLCTVPVFSDFTWANQGSATGNVTSGVLWIDTPTNAGDSIRLLYKASAGTANTVTIAIPHLYLNDTLKQHCIGLFLYDTGSTKAIAFYIQVGVGNLLQLVIDAFTNLTTFSGTNYYAKILQVSAAMTWLRIVDDGVTNRKYYVSVDGINFIEILSQARTSHFTTPNSVAFGVDAFAITGAPNRQGSCYSFATSSP